MNGRPSILLSGHGIRDPMTAGDDESQRMREFLVLWRLRAGPRTEGELAETLGIVPGCDEHGLLVSVIKTLEGRALIARLDDGHWELTGAGKEMVAGASESFTTGFMDLIEGCGEEE